MMIEAPKVIPRELSFLRLEPTGAVICWCNLQCIMDDQQIAVPELPPYGQDVQEDIESDPASENDVGRVRHYTQTPWSVRFDQLVAFKQESGNTNVPKGYSDKQLAKWVSKVQ